MKRFTGEENCIVQDTGVGEQLILLRLDPGEEWLWDIDLDSVIYPYFTKESGKKIKFSVEFYVYEEFIELMVNSDKIDVSRRERAMLKNNDVEDIYFAIVVKGVALPFHNKPV